MKPVVRALVITGYGINCEKEMALAVRIAGAQVDILHFQALLQDASLLDQYHLLCFPGGFSFADELGAAKTFANRISLGTDQQGQKVREKLHEFVEQGKCIIGICNGFQLLVKLGLLPGTGELLSLTHNKSGRFENRWCYHRSLKSHCIFTKGLESLYLPVRHGEGQLVASDARVLDTLMANGQVVFQYANPDGTPCDTYPGNPNGSRLSVAGLTDPSGRILGMMAHPEAFLLPWNHPRWTRGEMEGKTHGDGFYLFQNAIQYLDTTFFSTPNHPCNLEGKSETCPKV